MFHERALYRPSTHGVLVHGGNDEATLFGRRGNLVAERVKFCQGGVANGPMDHEVMNEGELLGNDGHHGSEIKVRRIKFLNGKI